MGPDTETPLAVAAVQLECRTGDAAYNVEHARRLAVEAFERGATLVALPEFFSGRVAVDDRVRDGVVAADGGIAVEMLRQLARRYSGFVGGSVLMRRGTDVYNTYCFVEPDGRVFTHDKDLPTMWENCWYVGGGDDGVFETRLGGVGAAVCWELIRERTLRRLNGRVSLAITGNHWWSVPENWGPLTRAFAAIGQYNRYRSENAPVEFARRLGVPVLHASHAGTFESRFLLCPGADWSVPYRTRFVGATQIVDAQGCVLARRDVAEGAGVVHAQVQLQPPVPVPQTATGFWVPGLTLFHRLYWHHQNACGRSYYRRHAAERASGSVAGGKSS